MHPAVIVRSRRKRSSRRLDDELRARPGAGYDHARTDDAAESAVPLCHRTADGPGVAADRVVSASIAARRALITDLLAVAERVRAERMREWRRAVSGRVGDVVRGKR